MKVDKKDLTWEPPQNSIRVEMDYLDSIARITTHIPDEGQVMIRYYGQYHSRHHNFLPDSDVVWGDSVPCTPVSPPFALQGACLIPGPCQS